MNTNMRQKKKRKKNITNIFFRFSFEIGLTLDVGEIALAMLLGRTNTLTAPRSDHARDYAIVEHLFRMFAKLCIRCIPLTNCKRYDFHSRESAPP